MVKVYFSGGARHTEWLYTKVVSYKMVAPDDHLKTEGGHDRAQRHARAESETDLVNPVKAEMKKQNEEEEVTDFARLNLY